MPAEPLKQTSAPNIRRLATLAAENGLTDAFMAERFVTYFGRDYRYDHDSKRWLRFREDQHRWCSSAPGEPTWRAIENARALQQQARRIQNDKTRQTVLSFTKYCQGVPGIRRVLSIVQDSVPVATRSASWNADPLIVGVPNGIIDLRTGELLEGTREHLVSLSLGALYEPHAKCPRWIAFLRQVFKTKDTFAEAQMVAYLQRVLGYVLTGLTTEQTWWLLFGPGSNGKSVFLNIIAHILGEYSKTVSFTIFELTNQRPTVGDGTEQLRHKRFVSAREAIEGLRLDEPRLKALTGADDVAARGLYTPYAEFKPELKLFLAANHKPTVKDDSFGFWRRVHVLNFSNLFVDAPKGDNEMKRDNNLEEALKAEASGILAWMVEGCRQWQQRGLNPPAAVTAATAEYQTESDHIGPFLDDCCELNSTANCGATTAFRAYQQWAVRQSIPEKERLTVAEFGSRMKKRLGQKPDEGHTRAGNLYIGVQLKAGY